MNKFICLNKRCNHIAVFSDLTSEDNPICPCCNNVMQYFNEEESKDKLGQMIIYDDIKRQIEYYGTKYTFEAIDRVYSNALTRAKIRKTFFEILKDLNIPFTR